MAVHVEGSESTMASQTRTVL